MTIASASAQPDQSGQDLAWSLGTIQGYDRAGVSLTVNLPNATTLQLDTGAQAYATAHISALFIKNWPRDFTGVLAPEQLPVETRRAIIAGMRKHSVRITHRTTVLKTPDSDAE